MKIAFCFNGQPRSLLSAHKNIKKFFVGFEDFDVFVHTWWDADEVGKHFDIWVNDGVWQSSEPATEDDLGLIDRIYKPKKMRVDYPLVNEEIKQEFDYQLRYDRFYEAILDEETREYGTEMRVCNFYRMWESIRRSVELKRDYEQEHGFLYDIVVKVRFDNGILDYFKFCPITSNTLYTANARYAGQVMGNWWFVTNNLRGRGLNGNYGNVGLDDIFFFSDSKTMDTISTINDYVDEIFRTSEDVLGCVHHIFEYFLRWANIQINCSIPEKCHTFNILR